MSWVYYQPKRLQYFSDNLPNQQRLKILFRYYFIFFVIALISFEIGTLVDSYLNFPQSFKSIDEFQGRLFQAHSWAKNSSFLPFITVLFSILAVGFVFQKIIHFQEHFIIGLSILPGIGLLGSLTIFNIEKGALLPIIFAVAFLFMSSFIIINYNNESKRNRLSIIAYPVILFAVSSVNKYVDFNYQQYFISILIALIFSLLTFTYTDKLLSLVKSRYRKKSTAQGLLTYNLEKNPYLKQENINPNWPELDRLLLEKSKINSKIAYQFAAFLLLRRSRYHKLSRSIIHKITSDDWFHFPLKKSLFQ